LALPPRPHPQTPRPPFPYREHDITYSGSGGVRMAGTLSIPRRPRTCPAVLLLSGSGASDRNGSSLPGDGDIYYHVIADRLARAGIAVLRVDDRGTGGSGGHPDPWETSLSELVDDAIAAVRYLRSHKAIAKDRVGLIGHSQGAWVAAAAAAASNDVGFVVMLAGGGIPKDQLIIERMNDHEAWLKENGADDAQLRLSRQAHDLEKRLMAMVKQGLAADAIRAELVGPELDEGDRLLAEFNVELVLQPHSRSFLLHDPADALRRVSVPVLALNGDRDWLVNADRNLPAIEKALRECGNRDFCVKRLVGYDHSFRRAETQDGVAAPGLSAQPRSELIDPAILDIVSRWIFDRDGVATTGDNRRPRLHHGR
jgi:pimeloyl-ACP methyl ester carboxylesterase